MSDSYCRSKALYIPGDSYGLHYYANLKTQVFIKILGSAETVLSLDCAGDYMTLWICQTLWNYTSKRVNYTVCKIF